MSKADFDLYFKVLSFLSYVRMLLYIKDFNIFSDADAGVMNQAEGF